MKLFITTLYALMFASLATTSEAALCGGVEIGSYKCCNDCLPPDSDYNCFYVHCLAANGPNDDKCNCWLAGRSVCPLAGK